MKKLPLALTLACLLAPASTRAQNAYITNQSSSTVSVIDTATDTVIATIPVGLTPFGVAVSPDGSKVYVTNVSSNTVSVIDTTTNTVSATIPVGLPPPPLCVPICDMAVAVSPDGSKIYVTNTFSNSNTVSVIDTATNTVSATIPIGASLGVAVTPDGSKVYVANLASNTVSVIDTATNTIIARTGDPLQGGSFGVAVSPDGSKVYVANGVSNTVSVIDTAANAVGPTIPVGNGPAAFGVFIQSLPRAGQPPPSFAGVAGSENCHGTSVSALATQFGGLDAAAAALGFSNVQGLQDAIRAFCEDSSSRL